MFCDIMKDTFKFLNNLLVNNDIIVLGISGGPDSMCLLSVLNTLKEKLNLKIICAHINHGLRKESVEEAKFVENYCKKNKIIFEYYCIEEYKNNKFTESEARAKRYNFFNSLIKKYQAKYLMTAHHGNDLEETILMRIVRGSNLKGYLGIPKISHNNDYDIVRPLLYVNKKEILEYINKYNVPYVVDKSNEDDIHTRNRYRKHVLPFLEKEEKLVHQKFLKYSEELESYHNYVNREIKKIIDNIYKDNKINIKNLLKEDKFLQRKIIEYVIEDIQKKELFNINDKEFNSILDLLKSDKNKQINLADNFIARRSYNYLIIEKNNDVDNYKYIFNKKISILNKYIIKEIKQSKDTSNYTTRINSKEVKLPLIVRNILPGDKMQIKNLKGSKKIKDIFIDIKLDKVKRKSYPIVTDSENNVIWLPGIKKSIFDKEISEKYDIILKYMEEE